MDAPVIADDTVVLSFDLWKTLIVSDPLYLLARSQLLVDSILPAMTFNDFDTLVRRYDVIADDIAETNGSDIDFEARVRMVAKAASGKRPSHSETTALYGRLADAFREHPPVLVDADTPGTLHQLSRRYQLALASNSGYMHSTETAWALERLGISHYFSVQIFSSDIGYAKPDPHFYRALCAAAQTRAEQITHIGNNLHADVDGAERAGLRAIHYLSGAPLADVLGLSPVTV